MSAYDRAGSRTSPGVGNHDRKAPPGVPPGTGGLLDPAIQGHRQLPRRVRRPPVPVRRRGAVRRPRIAPRSRPAGDPAGASTHYFADIGNVRWIFIDNSCWGIVDCDDLQNPRSPTPRATRASSSTSSSTRREAARKGMAVFAVMHMPTRDPRDQSYTDTDRASTTSMGKGEPSRRPTTASFERGRATRPGSTASSSATSRASSSTRAQGGVPYYIDGGAGGELYTDGPVGRRPRLLARLPAGAGGRRQDHHRHRPDLRQGRHPARGPGARCSRGAPGASSRPSASQPVFNDPAKVEPRAARPRPGAPGRAAPGLGAFVRGGGWIFVPVMLLVLGGLA